jgi:hypothetical protein
VERTIAQLWLWHRRRQGHFTLKCRWNFPNMRYLSLATAILAVFSSALATLPLPYRTLYEFPVGTWVENLHVRANGDILVSVLLPKAALYYVSDPAGPSPTVTHLANFTTIDSLLGVAEVSPDRVITFGGNFSSVAEPINGTSQVFEVNLNQYDPVAKPEVKLLTAIPEAVFLNGVQVLPNEPTSLLIADSTLGLVWKLDSLTARYSVAIQVSEMAVKEPNPFGLPVGINGLRVHDGNVYWTNSFTATIYRLAINSSGYAEPGAKVEAVGHVFNDFLDDMTTGPGDSDTIWAVTNTNNTVVAIGADGNAVVIEGSETELTMAGAAACQFGRTKKDADTLYITTCGGLAMPVNGTEVKGGSIVAIDTRSFEGQSCSV